MSLDQIELSALAAVRELLDYPNQKSGGVLLIGCSTSEVMGQKIGTQTSQTAAKKIWQGLSKGASEKNMQLAFQCCEHLNRALVVERSLAQQERLEIVHAVPAFDAGGAMAVTAWKNLQDPVLVENIQADYGLDIGNTLIGMHLKMVAVPCRLQTKKIGAADVNAAWCRPKLIGGARASYQ